MKRTGCSSDPEGDPEGPFYYRMKLLKPQNPADDTHLWQYVLRNIYPLGGTNIDAASFSFGMQISTFSDQPNLDLNADGDGSGLEWFRIFGFDLEDQQGADGADGLPDTHNPLIFDLANGLLKFPLNMSQPFNSSAEYYEFLAADPGFDFEASQLADNLMPTLYEPTNSEAVLQQDNTKFRFVVSHAAASSSFNLGVMNIEEGSETVTLDGRTLVKDVDYTIDYDFGEVNLKGEAAAGLSADSQIGVNYQYAPSWAAATRASWASTWAISSTAKTSCRRPGSTSPIRWSATRPSSARSPAAPWSAT